MMSFSSLLRYSNSDALSLSQQTAQYLQKYASTGTSRLTIPIPVLSYPESTDIWLTHERLFLSCLRTGDDKAAFNCLEKLITRFGVTNERIMGLRGLYQEAVAKDDAALGKVLQEYNEVLAENTLNTVGVPETMPPTILLICTFRSQWRNVASHFFEICQGPLMQLTL